MKTKQTKVPWPCSYMAALLMLLLLPLGIKAQDSDESQDITYTVLTDCSEQGYDTQVLDCLFDDDTSNKWHVNHFSNKKPCVVTFQTSKPISVGGYCITTGDDEASTNLGRNPKSWKLYGRNDMPTSKSGTDGWTLIDYVSDDSRLPGDKCTTVTYSCAGSAAYQYFRWEISDVRNSTNGGDCVQASGFSLIQAEPFVEWSNANKTLTFKYSRKPAESEMTEGEYWCYGIDEKEESDTESPAWTRYLGEKGQVATVAFGLGFKNYYPTTCRRWFAGGYYLQNIQGLENLNTENVTDMNQMFYNCYKLTELDLSNFNTANVTDMSQMFYGCGELQTIYVDSIFTTVNCQNDDNQMFGLCTNLKGAAQCNGTDNIGTCYANYNTGYLTFKPASVSATVISGCSDTGYNDIQLPKNLFDGDTSTKWFINGFSDKKPLVITFQTKKPVSVCGYRITTADDTESINLGRNPKSWKLYGRNDMPTSKESTEGWTLIDEVTDDSKLTGENFMTATYKCFPSVKYEYFRWEISDIRTSSCNAVQASEFSLIQAVPYVEFNKTNKTLTFKYDESFAASETDEDNCSYYNMNKDNDGHPAWAEAINENGQATKVVIDQGFKSYYPTTCHEWFATGYYLQSIQGLENLNTENVNDMSQMFMGCNHLTSLDLSHFSTANVKQMNMMFYGCNALKTIYVGNGFTTDKCADNVENMFALCQNLKGAISYDATKTDNSYANYTTGYFTKMVGTNGADTLGATGNPLTIENLKIEDGKLFVLNEGEDCQAGTASYSRTMTSNWGTLCLPFTIDATADGNTCLFYSLKSVDAESVVLSQIESGLIDAGTPVVICKKESAQSDISIMTPEAKVVDSPLNATSGNRLVGTFVGEVLNDNEYFIAKDKFFSVTDYSAKGVKVNPFRAYIVSEISVTSAPELHISIDGGSTNIETIDAVDALNNTTTEYYDVIGRRTNGLQKGLNIVKTDGKTMKVIIK